MAGPIQPEVDGEFYINDDNDDFWLRESGAWNKKGRLVRAAYVCLVSVGPYPFTASQQFELALGESAIHFYPTFSAPRCLVTCEYPAAADCSVVFTDNLAGLLSTGSNVIVQADFTPASQTATLTINDVIVPAFAPLWVVMPASPDVAMAGLRALFAGEPA